MNTFTVDTWYGKTNEEMNELEAKTRERLAIVAEQFIKDCIDKNIEVSSADGFFYSLVFQQLTEARIKVTGGVKKHAK